jgi:hypothetical protein
MKTARSTTTKQNKQGLSKKPRPEIRDDMDSRKQKEKSIKKAPLRKKVARKKKTDDK